MPETMPLLEGIAFIPTPPPDALGWGLTHSVRRRLAYPTHVDWIPVVWAEHRAWDYWIVVDTGPIFLDHRLRNIWKQFSVLHLIGEPQSWVVIREAWDIETSLHCGI